MPELSQFHYGSIKTQSVQNNVSLTYLSQFHYGSIKTFDRWFDKEKYNYVSIPLWFD